MVAVGLTGICNLGATTNLRRCRRLKAGAADRKGAVLKNIQVLGCVLLAAASIAPAQAQDGFLGKLLKQVTRPVTALTSGSSPQIAARPAATVQPSPEQVAALHAAVLAKQPNPQIARDIQDAMPLIERLAQTGACAVDTGAWNAFNREAVKPTTWYDGLYMHLPRSGDQYHDGRYCLDVLRITDYAKPAANALSFKVYYISPQSQRARRQTFELMRSTEGPWQVKEIGYAS